MYLEVFLFVRKEKEVWIPNYLGQDQEEEGMGDT